MEIFARILSRVEAPLLQRHCSTVFNGELRHIEAESHEVVAAYKRLQEVREAVASLETGRVDVRRSASVMETVDATAQLQQELTQRIAFVENVLRSHAVIPHAPESTESIEESSTQKSKRKRKENDPSVREEQVEEMQSTKKTKALEYSKSESLEADSSSDESTASESSSETESEDETVPTAPPSSEPPTAPVTPVSWEGHVLDASTIAQRLFAAKMAPSIEELTQLVDGLAHVLANVPVFNEDFRSLATGQLNKLMSLTVDVFHSGQRNQSCLPLADTTLSALSQAIASDAGLEELCKFFDELAQIKQKMEKYGITTSYTDPTTRSSPASWEAKVITVSDVAQSLLTKKRRPTVEEVTGFLASLDAVVTSADIPPQIDFHQLANGHFELLFKLLIRVFTKVNNDPQFILSMQTAIGMLDHASSQAPVLRGLWSYLEKLSVMLDNMEKRAGETSAASSTPPAFHAAKWKRGVDQLCSNINELEASSDAVTFEKLEWVVGCVSEMLSKATTASSDDTKVVTPQTFYTVVRSTTRLFGHSEVDATYLPLLNRMLSTFKSMGESNSGSRDSVCGCKTSQFFAHTSRRPRDLPVVETTRLFFPPSGRFHRTLWL